MSKYTQALDIVMRQDYYFRHKNSSVGEVLDAENLIKELAKEKDEIESRKEKVVVGSVWECVVTCYGDNWQWHKGESVKVIKITDTHILTEAHLRDNFPTDQFSLCFKPKGEK